MSSSLDKLKALSSRLEAEGLAIPVLPPKRKRVKKEKVQKSVVPKSVPIVPVVAIDLEPKVEEKTKKLKIPTSIAPKTIEPKDIEHKSHHDSVREDNIIRVSILYRKLKIDEKSPDFEQIFIYKAMNLSGIGLKEDDFGEVREGKYIQIIAITYEPDKNGKKKAKNISLGYFGKAEILAQTRKNEIIEFVLRWRYEKAFQNVEHYKDLIARVNT